MEKKDEGLKNMTYQYLKTRFEERGLELTPIEAVRLRDVIQRCIDDSKNIKNQYENGFVVYAETEVRFFSEVFGIDIIEAAWSAGVGRKIEERYKEIVQYIREILRGEMEML